MTNDGRFEHVNMNRHTYVQLCRQSIYHFRLLFQFFCFVERRWQVNQRHVDGHIRFVRCVDVAGKAPRICSSNFGTKMSVRYGMIQTKNNAKLLGFLIQRDQIPICRLMLLRPILQSNQLGISRKRNNCQSRHDNMRFRIAYVLRSVAFVESRNTTHLSVPLSR